MVKIEIAKYAGFCFGVKRAYKLAFDAVENSEKKVFSIGELIHNPQVVERLEKKGAKKVDNVKNIDKNSSVIIRAHGIPFNDEQHLIDLNCEIIDATCPFVKVPEERVKYFDSKGYFIFIFGDKGHPEVEAISSRVLSKRVKVVSKIDDIDIKFLKTLKKVAVLAQTTSDFNHFNKIVSKIIENIKETMVINSICDATQKRQKSTIELAKRSNCMIIVGGFHSANTKRLHQLSKQYCKNSYHIEFVDQIDEKWFKKCEKIGISAGASTPEFVIKDVYKKIENCVKNLV